MNYLLLTCSVLLCSNIALQLAYSAPIGGTENAVVGQVTDFLASSEWLGPLAPVALSPFFGLAILSGAATYGPEWLGERSGLFADGSSLDNAPLFWIMAILAIASSLPRLSKVSKPIALACENLETYSSVVILIVLRFVAVEGTASIENAGELQAGLAADVVVSAMVAMNIVVINGVKLFFEFLIWLVPFPSIDAMLELGNKSMCAALMGIYMLSPAAATLLNLVLLLGCLIIFGWVRRRTGYYRNIIANPLLEKLLPDWFAEPGESFTAFLDSRQLGLPKFNRVFVEVDGQTVTVRGRWWLRYRDVSLRECRITTQPGLIADRVTLTSPDADPIIVRRRKSILAREPSAALA
ncbi:MAG TPA: hypothetical protein DDW52_25315 [Planctomycetaceae bacterium]|nr:hypothetical protein [Planctomycetaceae bacterium]